MHRTVRPVPIFFRYEYAYCYTPTTYWRCGEPNLLLSYVNEVIGYRRAVVQFGVPGTDPTVSCGLFPEAGCSSQRPTAGKNSGRTVPSELLDSVDMECSLCMR